MVIVYLDMMGGGGDSRESQGITAGSEGGDSSVFVVVKWLTSQCNTLRYQLCSRGVIGSQEIRRG